MIKVKNIAFAFLVLVFSSNALAEWSLLDSSSLGNLYLDKSKIKSKGNVYRVWTLMSFSRAQFTEDKKLYSSRIAVAEYDCSQVRTNLLNLSSYTFPMAEGGIVESYEYRAREWMAMAPNTLIEKVFEATCQKNK